MPKYVGTEDNDTIVGDRQRPNDIFGYLGDDSLVGGTKGDYIYGHDGDDTIVGGGGDDTLDGGGDKNLIFGGDGDDTFLADDGSTAYVGGDGRDLVTFLYLPRFSDDVLVVDLEAGTGAGLAEYATFQGVENVTGTSGMDTLRGNDEANVLTGYIGHDSIEGGGGADTLDGGEGFTDTITYKSSNAGVELDLAHGVGRGGDAEGDRFSNFEFVEGSRFADTFISSAQADSIEGGSGSDTISYEHADKGGRINTAFTGLGGDQLSGIENIVGSAFNDRIFGTSQANRLDGGGGADRLYGGSGADVLSGGSGADTLIGSLGVDRMTGGADADVFVFERFIDPAGARKADIIRDFSSEDGDLIDLFRIDASAAERGNQAFALIGSEDFAGVAGQLRYEALGSDVVVTGDLDGDASADFSMRLLGVTSLDASDFIL